MGGPRAEATSRTAGIPGKALLAVAVWGVSFVAIRVALPTFGPFGLVTVRLLLGAALMVVLLRVRGGAPWPRPGDRGRCVLLGVLLGVHLLIQAHGLEHTTAINTGWIIAVIPVTIALGARIFLDQRLQLIGWAGLAVATAGVLGVTASAPPEFADARWGDALQLVSCLTWTAYTLVGIGPVRRSGALTVTAFSTGIAVLVAALGSAWTGWRVGAVSADALLAVAFLGLLCSGLGYFLWLAALQEHGPTRVGAMLYLEPFFTVGAAAWILSEPVRGNTALGGLAVLGGVWLVRRGSPRPEPDPGRDGDQG